ncbi:MAG: peptidase M48 [Candidatus Rokuibacteriota bacterium]|nr:MAG: peptidase M48 [Candidatus Rokubacteria bacterium]
MPRSRAVYNRRMIEQDSARYHRLQLWLSLTRLALSAFYLAALAFAGGGAAVAAFAARLTASAPAQIAIVASAIGAGHTLLGLPLAWVSSWVLPRRYGLLHQPLSGWLADRAKAAVLGAAIGLAGVEVIYALLRVTPLWWLAASAVAFAFSIAMAAVVPIWILPMFFRLTPLADATLGARLLALAERAGVRAIGVWIADQSRKSRTANAAVVGLGRTRRILLYDTLAAGFRPEEIEAVLAHELGHHVHGDVRRGLAVQGVLGVVTFWLADQALRAGVGRLGYGDVADPAGLPWLALVLAVLGLVVTPLVNAFSRRIEREADDFALRLTRDPNGFIAAMERLATLNLAERRPHPLKEALLFSHPALDRRIARARAVA